MKPSKHMYYVRTATKTNQHTVWSEWFGPVIATGPYTAALHFAYKVQTNYERTKILTQVITEQDVLEIEFNLHQIGGEKTLTRVKQKPTKLTNLPRM